MIPLHRLDPFRADLELRSPNHGPRPEGAAIQLIVLHATADGGNEFGAENWMRNPRAEASAHLHFRRDGTIVRLVDDRRRAWHAGRSHWPGIPDVNGASLGWEIANRNDGREPYTDEQYRAVAAALRHYMPQGLARGDVTDHATIAPGRKTDPLGWDWARMWDLVSADLPAPVIELATGPTEEPSLPHTEEAHPLRRPVAEVAGADETVAGFLGRLGDVLGPIARIALSIVRARLEKRAAEELDEALDRVLGTPERR